MIEHLNKLRFDFTSEQIRSNATDVIRNSKKWIDGLVKNQVCSFESTIIPFSIHEAEVMKANANLSHLRNVSPFEEIRKASEDVQNLFLNYLVEMKTRKDLFNCLLKAKEKSYGDLCDIDKRYIDHLIKDFERNGLNLPDEKREEVFRTSKEITKNNIEFSANVTKASSETKLFFTKSELIGCSESFLNRLEKTEDGKYVVSLKFPDRHEIQRFCSNSETRKIIFETQTSLCNDVNPKLMADNIKLRNKLSSLLEVYNDDYTSYRLEIRMAKNKKNVLDFLNSTKEKVDPIYLKDLEALRELKREETGDEKAELELFDISYYDRIRIEKLHNLDCNLIRQYFTFSQVLRNLLEIYSKLFGLDFEIIEDPATHEIWHDEILYYRVRDSQTKEIVSYFYLDLFPRENKYQHFCVRELQPTYLRVVEDGRTERQVPIAVMICNFSRSGNVNMEPLMSLREVNTFCHEFGHLLHIINSRTRYARFSGYSVAFDFLELPSMMLEKLVYRVDVLRKISCHYETKEPLPLEICKSICESRVTNRSIVIISLIWRSQFDILSYSIPPDQLNGHQLKLLFDDCRFKSVRIENKSSKESNGSAIFHHLMHPTLYYDVGYYSYLWAEVMACDAFFVFTGGVGDEKSNKKHDNILECTEGGRKFKDEVLRWGGEKESMELLEIFLGRKTNDSAFFKSLM